MIQIKCRCCNKEWFVYNEDINMQKVCPFCGVTIADKSEFDDYDTLDKAIYGAITRKGIDIIQKPDQLIGFMLDIAPKLKKEIRIFARTIASIEAYSPHVNNLFVQNSVDLDSTLLHIRHILVEEDGLSETWADIICDGLSGAAKHYKSGGYYRFANVQINKLSQYTSIAAPIDGMVVPLDEIEVGKYLGKYVGWGCVIKTVEKTCVLHAPIDGCVEYSFVDNLGAVAFFESADGIINVDVIADGAVKYDSSQSGKIWKKGEPFAECDFSSIKQENEELEEGTLFVLLRRTSEQYEFYPLIRELRELGQVKNGDTVFTVDHRLLEIEGKQLYLDEFEDDFEDDFDSYFEDDDYFKE